GPVGRYRERWPLVRANIGFPVIHADAIQRPRRGLIRKRHHGMIADGTRKNVAEHDYGLSLLVEGCSDPAAFASIVKRDRRIADLRMIRGCPGEGEAGPYIFLAARLGIGTAAF